MWKNFENTLINNRLDSERFTQKAQRNRPVISKTELIEFIVLQLR